MEHTDEDTTFKAIMIFKERYGIKAPLTTEGMDEIIKELKQKQTKTKRRKK